MTETISSTEAARNLGDLLARIKHRGDRFILTKNSRPVAELQPIVPEAKGGTFGELQAALKMLPEDPDFAGGLEKVSRADTIPDNPWA